MCYVEIKEKQTALCEIRQKSQDRDKSQRRIKLDLIEEAVVAGGGGKGAGCNIQPLFSFWPFTLFSYLVFRQSIQTFKDERCLVLDIEHIKFNAGKVSAHFMVALRWEPFAI